MFGCSHFFVRGIVVQLRHCFTLLRSQRQHLVIVGRLCRSGSSVDYGLKLNGLINSTPQASKSLVFLVAITNPFARAIAAI